MASSSDDGRTEVHAGAGAGTLHHARCGSTCCRKARGAPPRLTVRLYHDARSAEVVEYQRARHFNAVYDYPNRDMRQPDEKAQVNRFLGEFLSVCLKHGVAVKEPVLVG